MFQVQRFGHSHTSCCGQLTCFRCASVAHASTDCILEPKCINCSQAHSADSKLYPKCKTEKEIQLPDHQPQLKQTSYHPQSSATAASPSESQPPIAVINTAPPLLIVYLSLLHLPHPQHVLFLKLPPLHSQNLLHPRMHKKKKKKKKKTSTPS
ncbi:hypothetical protein TNCV_4992721 [Trichonephila clavipes]|nr:hypothetical protein TNCV_4992721 [Trichonephila clavipes]